MKDIQIEVREEWKKMTFIQLHFVGSKRPLNVTVSSMCGDNEPVMFKTGVLSVGAEIL